MTTVTLVAPELLEEMIADYEAEASLISIATAHRLSKQTVSRLLSDAGVRIRWQGLDQDQVAQATRAYLSGQTIREVASDLGVGHSMVWRELELAGVELRPRVQRRGTSASRE